MKNIKGKTFAEPTSGVITMSPTGTNHSFSLGYVAIMDTIPPSFPQYLKEIRANTNVRVDSVMICPLSEGTLIVNTPLSPDKVTLPAEYIKANIGNFIPIQVTDISSDSTITNFLIGF